MPLIRSDVCGWKINESEFKALIHYYSRVPRVISLVPHYWMCLHFKIYVIEDILLEENDQQQVIWRHSIQCLSHISGLIFLFSQISHVSFGYVVPWCTEILLGVSSCCKQNFYINTRSETNHFCIWKVFLTLFVMNTQITQTALQSLPAVLQSISAKHH